MKHSNRVPCVSSKGFDAAAYVPPWSRRRRGAGQLQRSESNPTRGCLDCNAIRRCHFQFLFRISSTNGHCNSCKSYGCIRLPSQSACCTSGSSCVQIRKPSSVSLRSFSFRRLRILLPRFVRPSLILLCGPRHDVDKTSPRSPRTLQPVLLRLSVHTYFCKMGTRRAMHRSSSK